MYLQCLVTTNGFLGLRTLYGMYRSDVAGTVMHVEAQLYYLLAVMASVGSVVEEATYFHERGTMFTSQCGVQLCVKRFV